MRSAALVCTMLAALAACGTLTEAGDPSGTDVDAATDAGDATSDVDLDAEMDVADGAPSDAAIDACITCERMIFVTNDPVKAAGVTDETCNTAAQSSIRADIRKKIFQAWFSTSIPALTRLPHGTGKYRLPSGDVVADNFDELVGSGPKIAIDQNENGLLFVDPSLLVWTGTLSNGTTARAPDGAAFDCAGWTATDGGFLGAIGRYVDIGTNWTFFGEAVCNTAARLYCIER